MLCLLLYTFTNYHFVLQVCSLEDGRSLGPDEHGEIYIRGPVVMKGYVKKPQATRDAFDSKGWFKSGETRYNVKSSSHNFPMLFKYKYSNVKK